MHSIVNNGNPPYLASIIISTLLLLTGSCVLLSWHAPNLFSAIYTYSTLMAYNTAIAFIACGLGLIAINTRKHLLLVVSSIILFLIAILSLLDVIFTSVNLHTNNWFEIFLSEPPAHNQPISPVTSSVLLLAGLTLLFARCTTGNPTIVTALLCILMIFITLATVIGQGFSIFPTLLWLGKKMAPQTAIGLLAFAGAILYLRYTDAIHAFNRLNFFSRLSTGFIFMSLLFIGVGSIGVLQINNVATISQKLYEGPLQTHNAALHIKNQVGKLNRTLKDIAVNPSLAEQRHIVDLLKQTQTYLHQELEVIQRDPLNQSYAEQVHALLMQWLTFILQSYAQLQAGDIESYRSTTLNIGQAHAAKLEVLCDDILQLAQEQMISFNKEAVSTTTNAGNLMLIVIIGFLFVGILVAGLITRSLSWQLEKLRHAMLDIAGGNTQLAIPFCDHPYEIGDMAKTLKVFARNIDERKKSAQLLVQHQQELEKTNLRLAQTNKELETFAYVASHDLKSPLRGIAQLSTWIDEDLEEKEFSEVEKHTQMLRNRIHRMEKLLDDMLIFYRAGKVDGNITRVDLAHMAKELFEIQNTKSGLQLELGSDLPTFDTLSTPFEQILRNLFSNAIKHHDLEHGVVRIEARQLDDEFYEISVSDNGPGIPAKFQERVFGMFQTLKPRDELEGSGMGLALIKKIVETYGGNISVYSEGRGCRFTFTWPCTIKRKQDHD